MSITSKLNYLKDTKDSMKTSLNSMGAGITDETFREYPDIIEDLYTNWPKLNTSGETLSLDTIKGTMTLDPKGDTSQVQYSGKNLLNVSNSYSITTQDTKTINLPTGTYTLSCTNLTTNTETNACLIQLTGESSQQVYMYYNDKKVTFTTTEAKTSIKIYSGTTYANSEGKTTTFTDLMLESGSTQTSYEPYTGGIASPNPSYPQELKVVKGDNTITITNSDSSETQTYQLNLPGTMELRKIGDYQDYFYKENDTWYKYKAIEKYILDGSENWEVSGDGFYCTTISNYATSGNTPYCDKYKGINNVVNISSLSNNQIAFNTNPSFNRLYIMDSRFTTGTDVQTWLNNNNAILYYVLRTPTSGEIVDATLIEQLEALASAMSYNGTTNINQTNTDQPFMISVSVLKGSGV